MKAPDELALYQMKDLSLSISNRQPARTERVRTQVQAYREKWGDRAVADLAAAMLVWALGEME